MDGKILVVDDDQAMCEFAGQALKTQGFQVHWMTSVEEALQTLRADDYDVVLTDLRMPQMDGLEFCARILELRPDIPVVVFTAFGSLETAIAAIRAGAYDYVNKPIEIEDLALTLERAIKHGSLIQTVKNLQHLVADMEGFGQLLGHSEPMNRLYLLLSRAASSEVSVLITGESGTGKELVARSLHDQGPRAKGPFVSFNCAAVQETLIESELFGHVKGAFTDAKTGRKGLFQHAQGGTLFLDEVADLPLGLQPKLLRALEERRIRPVGQDQEVKTDVRLLAATNRDLDELVESGGFRKDLFYRINVIRIEVPPLRARGHDILLLAGHFLERFGEAFRRPPKTIGRNAAEKLLAYPWPGNVRELRNCMERAVTLSSGTELLIEDLPEKVRNYRMEKFTIEGHDPRDLISLEEMERRYILHALNTLGQNKARAAKILGVDRKTLYRKLERTEPKT